MSGIGKRREILLRPGEHFTGDASCRIRTLLGSCVSITLWHRERQVGTMCHFMLETRPSPKTRQLDGRYGDEAILLMLQGLVDHGADPAKCEAKIFGGGNMFPDRAANGGKAIGKRNGEAAWALLEALEIPVVASSLFGVGYRQIIFDVQTGRVWSRQQTPSDCIPSASGPRFLR
jgi:chemotaxis protein CheD